MPKHPVNSAYEYVQKHRRLKRKREISSSTDSDNDVASIISDDSEDRSDISAWSHNSYQEADSSASHRSVMIELPASEPNDILARSFDDSASEMSVDEGQFNDHMSSDSSSNLNSDLDNFPIEQELENPDDLPNLQQALRLWAVRNIGTLKNSVITELLQVLRSFGHKLPATATTLLQTKRTGTNLIEIMDIKGGQFGQYAYFGIEKELAKRISPEIYREEKIKVLVNIDGLPIHRNSKQQFWPLLMQVCHKNYANKPFVVAIFSGPGKPMSPHLFLKDFVPEAAELSTSGVTIQGRVYLFEIIAFVCDTPARAFLKCIKSHVAFSSCERCVVRGKTINHRRVFANPDCELRTAETFRHKDDPQHHLDGDTSPLLNIPNFDIVKSFTLDYMHLLCVGVMKALLQKWISGNRLSRVEKWKLEILQQLLIALQVDIPSEFQRKKLDLNDLTNWKATQYRFFILYCGALLLKDILPPEKYKHFMLLFAASRILCGRETALSMVDTASEYLKKFFILLPTFYGTESQVTNFHNLLHVADDVRHLKMPLSAFSTFPFENALSMIKKLIRTPRLPLSQVCRRLSELEVSSEGLVRPHALITNCERLKNYDQCEYEAAYKEIHLKGMRINISHPNNIVQLQNDSIFQIQQIFALRQDAQSVADLLIEGQSIGIAGSAFNYPCDSQLMGIYNLGEPSVTTVRFLASEIKKKCIKLSVGQRSYGLTLLH